MEKRSSEIFRQKATIYFVTIFLFAEFFSIQCSKQDSTEPNPVLRAPAPSPKFRGIQVVEKSDSVYYYELPDALDDIDPESIPTFKTKIKNKVVIEKIQSIIKNGTFSYTLEKSKRCLPAYNAAIVFRKGEKRSVILVSSHCAILKTLEENLYLNFDKEKDEIEKLFSEMRK